MATFLASAGGNVLKTFEFAAEDDPNLHGRTVSDGLGDQITALSWNHTNQVIAVGGMGQKITLIQSSNGQFLSSIPFHDADAPQLDKVTDLCFSGNSRYLASSTASSILLWDLKKRSLKTTLANPTGAVTCLSLSQDGARCLTGDMNGAVRLWDVRPGTQRELPPTSPRGNAARAAAISTIDQPLPSLVSSPRVAAGATDGVLTVWDQRANAMIASGTCHTGPVAGLAFSPKNGRLVATCGSDGRLCLYDIGSGAVGRDDASATAEIPDDALTSVSFHENAIQCAVGTAAGWLHLFDWRNTRHPLSSIRAHNGQPVSALGFQRPTSTGSGARSAAAATPALKSTGVHAHHHHYHDDRSNTGSGSGSGSHRKSQTSVSVGIASTEGAPSSPLMSTAHTPPRTMSRKVKEKSSRSPKSQRSAERAAAAAAEEEEALAVAAAANVSSALPPPPSSSQSERSPPRRRGDDPSGASSPAVLPPTPSMGDTPPITVTGKASLTPAASHDAGWSQQSLGSLAGKGSGSGSSVWGHTSSPWGAGAHRVSGRPSPGPVLYAPTDVDEEAVGGVNMSGLEVERGEDELPISNRVFQEAMLGLRYDIHREMQSVIKEQARQFSLAKQDMSEAMGRLSTQLEDMLQANAALRLENERLRNIY